MRRASLTGCVVAVVLLVIAVAGATPAAAAGAPMVAWCGADVPHLSIDGLLPGEARRLEVDLCNIGGSSGALRVVTAGAPAGPLGDVVELSLANGSDVLWDAVPVRLLADGAADGGSLPAGGARHLTLSVSLAAAADNRVAGQSLDVGVIFELVEEAATGGGASVVLPAPGGGRTGGGADVELPAPAPGGRAEPPSPDRSVTVTVGNGAPARVSPPARRPAGALPLTGLDALGLASLAVAVLAAGGAVRSAGRTVDRD